MSIIYFIMLLNLRNTKENNDRKTFLTFQYINYSELKNNNVRI